MFGPDDNRALRGSEFPSDHRIELLTCRDVPVPLDRPAAGRQHLGELFDPRAIFVRIADEDVAHW